MRLDFGNAPIHTHLPILEQFNIRIVFVPTLPPIRINLKRTSCARFMPSSALELRAEYLRNQCAERVEEYVHNINCVGPNLKARYMVEIGQFEYRVYELKMRVARWKRRYTLRQQALNRGEKPDYVKIEATLDAEFAAYQKEIQAHQAEIDAASKHYSCESLSFLTSLVDEVVGGRKKLTPSDGLDALIRSRIFKK